MKKYTVTGMSCAACSARVEKAVKTVPGVKECSVNLLTNSMTVEGSAPESDIISAVENAGYGVKTEIQPKPLENNLSPMIYRLIFSAVLMLAVMYFSMGYTMWGFPAFKLENQPAIIALIELILTALVMVINQKFFINGFKGALHRAPNMDTLVALGASAAFIYSTAVYVRMLIILQNGGHAGHFLHEMYFESAATILTLITLGKLLESYSKGKTANALKGLMRLAPETAEIEIDGNLETVPVEQLQVGCVFILRPGSRVPADGIVLEGSGAVDESAITGESMPTDKKPGDTVSSATIQLSGHMRCRATKIGEDTTLSQIIKMVSDASAAKAPISKIADKVSGIFVPVVLSIAVLSTAAWLISGSSAGYALARGISVLVISCPCALGLATPVAIMAASGIGAKYGILFKNAASIENTGKIKTAVFDKTGTVTSGIPKITDIIPCDGVSKQTLMSIACSLEQKSEHPIAGAILEYKAETIQTDDFENFSGGGIVAAINSEKFVCGNLNLVSGFAKFPDNLIEKAERLSDDGKTLVFVAKEKTPLGLIAVADVIKKESREAIAELHDMGIKTVMLTGDNVRTANAVAKQAGMDNVIAGVLPDGKAGAVRELMQNGKVAMVGDGINDAPALTVADIGMAIGAGTDIAIDSADIVIVSGKLTDVTAAVKLSRAALRIIHQNLFWAFIYNIVGIPLAAGVFVPLLGWELSPMFGAAAMSLSSFSVITNALRLNLFNPYNKMLRMESLKMEKTFKVDGMMCPHCEGRVKKALEKIDGVLEAYASHESGTVTVTLIKDISDEIIESAIQNEGYSVKQ